ncbi:FixH family protein [Rossellomorea vietnamensis]|uniref:FixH family protein n=1 Tax=Rossellomorea vietnamensis TaxID=218284 RepID=UPI003CF4C7DD
MKKLLPFLMIISIVLLGACGSKENNHEEHGDGHSGEEGGLTAISADLSVPDTAEPGETVEFSTHVTQGEENITDATEVEYEIWKEGQKEDSEMIEAENHEDGHYTAEKTFDEDGVYHVQVHVTANDMHTMPKTQIAVGNAEVTEDHESHSSEEGDHDHGHSEVSFHLMKPDTIKSGTDTELTAQLEKDGKPLEAAGIRFEIWLEGTEDHAWVETQESEAGSYKGNYEFAESGLYHVTIHAENDEGLHEHSEEEIIVE